MRLKRRLGQADMADEAGNARHLHRPEAEIPLGQPGADAIGRGVALRTVELLRAMRHQARVGVECRERRQILVPPGP